MTDEIKLKDMIDFLENVYKDIKKQPTLEEELEKERKFINKIKGNNEDEIKEILDKLKESVTNPIDIEVDQFTQEAYDVPNFFCLDPNTNDCKILLDYITTLQEKYNKALELLADFNLPCEYDEFNITGGIDYCEKNCSVDDEQYKKCWNKFIEWKLKDE